MIGFLNGAAEKGYKPFQAAFLTGLAEGGFVAGRTVALEYRWAGGRYDLLPQLAAELVARKVDVIAATGGLPAALAAKAATDVVPIVFLSGGDPVRDGIVTSLNRPEANITGMTAFVTALDTKRLEVLAELAPGASTLGMLINPGSPYNKYDTQEAASAARRLGRALAVVPVAREAEFEAGFAALKRQRAGALLVGGDPFFLSRRDSLVRLAGAHALPAVYGWAEFTRAGGLVSYGPELTDLYREVAGYVARILRGAKPADLPVMQPSKLKLLVNLSAAMTLGIEMPASLLARADEVIE